MGIVYHSAGANVQINVKLELSHYTFMLFSEFDMKMTSHLGSVWFYGKKVEGRKITEIDR
jgi:hypothetical protein